MLNRAQQFQARHERFLPLWADGLHPLEISHRLNLSQSQLWRHIAKAVEDRAPHTEPQYGCVLWETLPATLKKAMPSYEATALVKVHTMTNGQVLLELMGQASEAQPGPEM